MKKYRVTFHYDVVVEVEAFDELVAEDIAYAKVKNRNISPFYNEMEIEELDEKC